MERKQENVFENTVYKICTVLFKTHFLFTTIYVCRVFFHWKRLGSHLSIKISSYLHRNHIPGKTVFILKQVPGSVNDKKSGPSLSVLTLWFQVPSLSLSAVSCSCRAPAHLLCPWLASSTGSVTSSLVSLSLPCRWETLCYIQARGDRLFQRLCSKIGSQLFSALYCLIDR